MLHIKKQYECNYALNAVAQKCESDLSISVGLEDDDLFNWRVCFQGPENTPFEGGLYEATLRFPLEFPYQPPKMLFKT
jgi:ubiquitin-conjugating enzyme E2 G1